ncbi:hypothetical protein J2Y60_002835 [Arcicella sp. BE140]|nr:hypothetical protein [Arcicella sp. BE51]MDR6812629.1 hypothetical protein [Arcicella sp. BE140]MDR6823941.1 hypothetical protein [Arcicella sp. BE139]
MKFYIKKTILIINTKKNYLKSSSLEVKYSEIGGIFKQVLF